MKISMSISDSFGARVQAALLKGGSFKQPMTRPLMLLAVFEANRILLAKATAAKNDNAKSIRPFQRKIALLSIAMDLIYSLDFLSESEKLEIIGKTRKEGTKVDSKPVLAKLAFHRGDTLQKEVDAKFIPMMKMFMNETGQDGMQSHEDLCNAFCQNKFEKNSGNSGDRPKFWELRRMPLFAVYRVYYRGFQVDEDIFPADAPREIQLKDLPSKRPNDLSAYVFGTWAPIGSDVKPFANDEAAAGTAQDEAMEDGERVAKAAPSPRVRRVICNKGRDQQGPRKNKNREVVRMPIVAVDNAESNEKIASAPAAVATPRPRAKKVLVVNKMMPHGGVAKNIQILLQIKTRMRLLKELEVEGVLPQKRIQREKRMLLRALPPLVSSSSGIAKKKAASAATNGIGEYCPRVQLMETNLRMELLKEMKDMMPPKRYGNEMKQLFLWLPALPSPVSKMDEKKSGKENADVSDEEDMKVDEEEMQFEVVKSSVDADDGIDKDGAWEEVDGTVNMEEMNESVSAIGLA